MVSRACFCCNEAKCFFWPYAMLCKITVGYASLWEISIEFEEFSQRCLRCTVVLCYFLLRSIWKGQSVAQLDGLAELGQQVAFDSGVSQCVTCTNWPNVLIILNFISIGSAAFNLHHRPVALGVAAPSSEILVLALGRVTMCWALTAASASTWIVLPVLCTLAVERTVMLPCDIA